MEEIRQKRTDRLRSTKDERYVKQILKNEKVKGFRNTPKEVDVVVVVVVVQNFLFCVL
jgi:hypothetical protein